MTMDEIITKAILDITTSVYILSITVFIMSVIIAYLIFKEKFHAVLSGGNKKR